MLALLLAAAAVTPADGPAPPVAPSVLLELGLTPPADLPAVYAPDAVTLEQVRRNPKLYPLRAAVLAAVSALDPARRLATGTVVLEATPDAVRKRQMANRQEPAARAILEMSDAHDQLKAALARRTDEKSKRWQAHADYVAAELQVRLAAAHEYDLALAAVRVDGLPELDRAKGQNGWRLVPAEKMHSRKDIRDLAAAGKKAFATVAEQYPDTPWAKLAGEFEAKPTGLDWRPAVIPPPKK